MARTRRTTHQDPKETAAIANIWLMAPGNPALDVEAETERVVATSRLDEYHRKQRDRAKAGAESRRDNAARRNAALQSEVRALRAKHPAWKTRTIARAMHLKKRLPRPDNDEARAKERRAINALAKRIRTLEHPPAQK